MSVYSIIFSIIFLLFLTFCLIQRFSEKLSPLFSLFGKKIIILFLDDNDKIILMNYKVKLVYLGNSKRN